MEQTMMLIPREHQEEYHRLLAQEDSPLQTRKGMEKWASEHGCTFASVKVDKFRQLAPEALFRAFAEKLSAEKYNYAT
jgi:hypothetical protein